MGRRGIASFSVEIQAIVFIRRNVIFDPSGQLLSHPGKRACPCRETRAAPQGKAGDCQGNGECPVMGIGERLSAAPETGTSLDSVREVCHMAAVSIRETCWSVPY